MNSPAHLLNVSRFAGITGALCRAVAASLGRGVMQAAMIMLVWRRIRRAEVLMLALLVRLQAGGPDRRAGRLVGAARAEGSKRVGVDASVLRIPRRLGWLLQAVPCEAANLAGQLRVVLAEPGMAGVLAASPQAVRILRPLCRLLGLQVDEFAGCAPAVRVVSTAPVLPMLGEAVRGWGEDVLVLRQQRRLRRLRLMDG